MTERIIVDFDTMTKTDLLAMAFESLHRYVSIVDEMAVLREKVDMLSDEAKKKEYRIQYLERQLEGLRQDRRNGVNRFTETYPWEKKEKK